MKFQFSPLRFFRKHRRLKERAREKHWRNLHLLGDRDVKVGMLFYSGFGANGAQSQRRIARELHRRFDRRFEFWQRNLWGHTGFFGDFRESRMWSWTADALFAIKELTGRRKKEQLFLIGHSAGALICIIVAWLVSRLPRLFQKKDSDVRLKGVVLTAPAFRLLNRRDEFLLTFVFLLYYLLSPAMLIGLFFISPVTWDLALLVAVFYVLLLPRIRVPGLRQRRVGENLRQVARSQRRALVVLLYFGIFPFLILLTATFWAVFYVRIMLWLFLASIIAGMFLLPCKDILDLNWDDDDDQICDQYSSIPVVSAATLVPLQWAARFAVKRLSCSLLFIVYGRDRVVDNGVNKTLFSQLGTADKELLELRELPHAGLSGEQQLRVAAEVEHWLRARLPAGLPEAPAKRSAVASG